MPVILALDLGTRMGWAIENEIGLVTSGAMDLKENQFSGGGMRYMRMLQWLEALDPAPEAVYFEIVRRHLGTAAAHAYGGFLAVLTGWCEKRGIPYKGFSVGAIKRWATGAGNASKTDMMTAAQLQYPDMVVDDDNQADAMAVLGCALTEIYANAHR